MEHSLPAFDDGNAWLTVPEIATELRVHQLTVKRWIRAGKLSAIQFGDGGPFRIRRSWLAAYLERQTNVNNRCPDCGSMMDLLGHLDRAHFHREDWECPKCGNQVTRQLSVRRPKRVSRSKATASPKSSSVVT